MTTTAQELLRAIPAVDRLLAAEELRPLLARASRSEVVGELRRVLDELRAAAAADGVEPTELNTTAIARRVDEGVARRARPYYRRVINATGVILHTNLGRAPLADEAVATLAATAGGAQRLELDLESGRRGGRDEGCAALLRELTGCAAATVVNNNAAATLLVLAALAGGRGVVLSRGEMVEIGGSFRVPEILRESGARLIEVGTTNRTHERDYRAALAATGDGAGAAGDDPLGLILKVHASNYRIEGFTAEVPIEALVAIGREHGVPVVHDLGSGCLVDTAARGLPVEPLVQRSVAASADVVCFSGDKLLGGPQAGLLLGSEEAIGRCRRHPLYRALRPGRLVYAALEATLRLYRGGEEAAWERVPALARLAAGAEELRGRAERLAAEVAAAAGGDGGGRLAIDVVECASQAGSGSLFVRDLPSWKVRLTSAAGSAEDLAAALRAADPAIVARVQDGAVLFDLRTVADDELAPIAARVAEIAAAE